MSMKERYQQKTGSSAKGVKLGEFRDTCEDALEDLKAGHELAWDSLGEAVKSATSRFNQTFV